jgi:N-acetylglucosamine-6-phosphate deacetylase
MVANQDAFDLVIRGGAVLCGAEFRSGVDVGIAKGRIAALGSNLKGETEVDARGLRVIPGFVDVHVHGAGGSDEPEQMARFLPSTGVTGFVPTLASSSPEDTYAFVERVAGAMPQPGSAEILGSHLEGPWLNSEWRGAHLFEHVRPPDLDEARRLLEGANSTLRRVTLAPELPGAHAVIELLAKSGVQVSLGHSACSYSEAVAATEKGATSVTHVYNAMLPFHHREPGLAGAALVCDTLLVELIADGVHVHAAAACALVKARSADTVAIVSDGLPPLGLAPGDYNWQGRTVSSDGIVCRLEDKLVGSASSVLRGLRELVSWGVPLASACQMASGTGAVLAAANKRKGLIAEGYDADLVLLDAGLNLVRAYCRGVPAR